MSSIRVFLLLTVLSVTALGAENDTCRSSVNKERDLLKCLLHPDFDPSVRPVEHGNQTVDVTFTLYLVKIFELNEKSQVLSTQAWIHQTWMDKQLAWKPVDHGDIESIRIPVERIWTPDIVLYNTAVDAMTPLMDKLVVVQSSGKVTWVPYISLHSHCDLDFARYPFDTQTCTLWFGSWTYDIKKVNIRMGKKTNETDMLLNAERVWKVTHHKRERQEIAYNQHETYPTMVYTITMERNSSFQQVMMIGPIVFLAVLSCVLFCIPSSSAQRIQLGSAILLGILLMFLLLDSHMPVELVKMPVVGAYMFFVFMMTSFAVITSVALMNCTHREGKLSKVPDIVRNVLLNKVGRFVCITQEPYTSLLYHNSTQPSRHSDGDEEIMSVDRQLKADTEFSNETPLPKSPTLALEQVLNEIRRYLKICAEKEHNSGGSSGNSGGRSGGGEELVIAQTSHRELVMSEWLKVATVIDRLCFLFYVAVMIIATISMLSH